MFAVEAEILCTFRDDRSDVSPVVRQARFVFWYHDIGLFSWLRLGLLQRWNFIINLMTETAVMMAVIWRQLAKHTRAIAKYSTTTDATFIEKLMMMATSVEMPLMRAIKRGPMSLQIKSIRLIRALMTLHKSVRVRRGTNTRNKPYFSETFHSSPSQQQSVQDLRASITKNKERNITQSLSTETRFMIAHNFSTQARIVSSASSPSFEPRGMFSPMDNR